MLLLVQYLHLLLPMENTTYMKWGKSRKIIWFFCSLIFVLRTYVLPCILSYWCYTFCICSKHSLCRHVHVPQTFFFLIFLGIKNTLTLIEGKDKFRYHGLAWICMKFFWALFHLGITEYDCKVFFPKIKTEI